MDSKIRLLSELGCHMVFEKNETMGCINGYLVKSDGTLGYIKAFLHHTNEESEFGATVWANNNTRMLKNAGYGESFQLQKLDSTPIVVVGTRDEKIKILLGTGCDTAIISPSEASECEFGATFKGMRMGYYQFVDGDGDYWDCSADEIDKIILDSGEEIDVSNIKDDQPSVKTDVSDAFSFVPEEEPSLTCANKI